MFVTVFCLILNTETGEAECCSGGHNRPCSAPTTGVVNIWTHRPEWSSLPGEFRLQIQNHPPQVRRDALSLYRRRHRGTDPGWNFSPSSASRLCSALRDRDLPEIIAAVTQEIALHAQTEPQSDDITMLALTYNGPAKKSLVAWQGVFRGLGWVAGAKLLGMGDR